MRNPSSNVLQFRPPANDFLNQELEAAELELATVREFIKQSEKQRDAILIELHESKQALLEVISSVSRLYRSL